MNKPPKEKPFLQAIQGKVIAAFLLAFTAIVFALAITYFSFNDLLDTVDHLASPNEKLKKLNTFFQQVTQLDQQQRAEAIKNPQKPSEEFIQESKVLLQQIDSLRGMDWKDLQQLERLNAMEKILIRRNDLFLSYLKLKTDFIFNPNLSKRIDSLTGVLSNNRVKTDTSVRTTQKKVVTKTYLPGTEQKKTEDSRSFFSRLFGRKKDTKTDEPKVEVQEELSVKIDTLAIAQQDSVIGEVGRIMKSLAKDQRQQNRNVIQGELELINTNTILINQLTGILHQVEEEEFALMHANSKGATQLVGSAIKRIGGIMLLFFLGAAVLVFLILTDIAASNYYRKQLVKAKDEAEQLGLVKQRFLANMSHEIRTPLQSIIGFSEQMRQNYPQGKDALDAIHSSSEHLLHIVNEVLDYSRIESGKFTVEREPFNLSKVLREVSAGIEIQAEQKGLTFIQEVSDESELFLLGDGFRLRQILYNLLGNAVKFTSKGYVKLSVDIEKTDHTIKCKFQISDTGIGMDPKDIDRVFQQFEQANASINHHYGGTGLGLTIVKALVEVQNGTLSVSSELTKGSTFIIQLNYDRAPIAVIESIQHNKVEQRNQIHGKVLIVDDDPLILKLCSLIMRKHNIDHLTFQDPNKVKQYTGFDNVDLILLDIRMPNINGIELCHAIRKKIKKDTRIVALTAHVLPQERAGLINEGFDEILTKPFREQQLLDVVGVKTSDVQAGVDNESSVDFSILKKMAMGDEALFQSIVAQFIEESEGDVKKMKGQATSVNGSMIREIAHKLAGRTGQMGMPIVSSRFREIENALVEGKPIEVLQREIETAIQDLENIIKVIQEDVLNT